jgi:toxin ParE1/3/4
MAQIAWTLEAERWLSDIYDYIASDNPVAAMETVQGIYDRAQVLVDLPESGSRYWASERHVRELLYGHYRITYLVKDD